MSSLFFESKEAGQMGSWLAAKEFSGKDDISKVRIEGENLILEITEAADCQQLFDYLTTVSSLKENQVQVLKHASNQLSVPLSKKAVTMLSACGYLSNEVYFKLLHIVVAIEVAKEAGECDYSPTSGEEGGPTVVKRDL